MDRPQKPMPPKSVVKPDMSGNIIGVFLLIEVVVLLVFMVVTTID